MSACRYYALKLKRGKQQLELKFSSQERNEELDMWYEAIYGEGNSRDSQGRANEFAGPYYYLNETIFTDSNFNKQLRLRLFREGRDPVLKFVWVDWLVHAGSHNVRADKQTKSN